MATATDDTLGIRIVQQVATREDVDPTDLEPPLYEAVDVDALESLISGGPTGHETFTGSVSFEYCGYTITVDHDGAVDVLTSPATADGSSGGQGGGPADSSAGERRLVGKR